MASLRELSRTLDELLVDRGMQVKAIVEQKASNTITVILEPRDVYREYTATRLVTEISDYLQTHLDQRDLDRIDNSSFWKILEELERRARFYTETERTA